MLSVGGPRRLCDFRSQRGTRHGTDMGHGGVLVIAWAKDMDESSACELQG